jgi:hypothetical protein
MKLIERLLNSHESTDLGELKKLCLEARRSLVMHQAYGVAPEPNQDEGNDYELHILTGEWGENEHGECPLKKTWCGLDDAPHAFTSIDKVLLDFLSRAKSTSPTTKRVPSEKLCRECLDAAREAADAVALALPMPEHVKHVLTGRWTAPEAEGGRAVEVAHCGVDTSFMWAFVNPAHALQSVANGDRFEICPACADSIAALLERGRFDASES